MNIFQIEGQMAEVKGVGRRRQLLDDLSNRRRYWEQKEEAEDKRRWKGRRTQLLDDLRNRRRYWEQKEEAEDRKRWRR